MASFPEQNIIVADAEFAAEASRVSTDADSTEEVLTTLSQNLTDLSTEGLVKGVTAEVFKKYVETVESMKGKFYTLAEEESRLITQMIGEIEAADNFAYSQK